MTAIIDQNEAFEKKSSQKMNSSTKKSRVKMIDPEKLEKFYSEKKAELQRLKAEKANSKERPK